MKPDRPGLRPMNRTMRQVEPEQIVSPAHGIIKDALTTVCDDPKQSAMPSQGSSVHSSGHLNRSGARTPQGKYY